MPRTIASGIGPTGASATVREIAQQPQIWAAVAELVQRRRSELDAFLAVLLERRDRRIVLTGAGTSAFVGAIAAPSLARSLGRRVDAIPTTDIVSDPLGAFPDDVPTLLVSFARSGNSPESIAATEVADRVLSEVSHLVLTCDESGALFVRHAERTDSMILLMPERSNDEGFAMTSSFTSMLLAALLVFGGPADDVVKALAAAATHVLESRQGEIESLTQRPIDRVVYLGSGPLAGLARESALKLLELTAGRIVGYHESVLGFRHGPKAILDDRTLVVLYVSSDPHTRRYDLDLLPELRSGSQPQQVIAVSASSLDDAEGPSWVLPGLEGVPDAFAAVAFVIFAQLLALHCSLQLGLTPDNPFPGGAVNRVVRGVRIHEFDGRPSTER